ncbi:uncharacterized protein J8A68_000679 [[Candida] subhashii]|uniref:Uncharacterized protein n=1 Tax=[Candida] subhashii TaxID=561895 RepID=A0A8J5ULJ2_9ASCO|nr:uncharacterized protein J8A68_000679 [[Candida] subhashii]KAG7665853.1 hypothetical protein J8A68_000679 [[Candida] subhashii]
MSEEISLSIEETNKLRLKAGLKPIPIPRQQQQPKDDSIIELSIEETNKLRISIGLKPIPIEKSQEDIEIENYRKYQEQKRAQVEIQNARKRRPQEETMIIPDRIESEGIVDTDDWLNNLGKPSIKKQKKPLLTKSNKTDDIDIKETRIGHTGKELRQIHNEEILTLADTDIINNEDEDEGDILTNERLLAEAKLKRDLDEKKQAESVKYSGRRYQNQDDKSESEDEDEEGGSEYLTKEKLVMTGSEIVLPKSKDVDRSKKSNADMKFGDLFEELDTVEEVKKPKNVIKMKKIKQKKNSSRPKIVSESIKTEPIELENIEVDIEDEYEELQQAIKSSRESKQKSKGALSVEQLAYEIAETRRWEFENKLEKEEFDTFDDTSDFLNNLDKKVLSKQEDEEEPHLKIKIDSDGVEDNGTKESLENGARDENKHDEHEDEDRTTAEPEEGPKFNRSLAETLKFLHAKNLVSKETDLEKKQELERKEAAKQSELLRIKIGIEERILRDELEKDKSYMKLSKVDREVMFSKELDKRLVSKGIVVDNNTNNRSYDRRINGNKNTNKKSENKLKQYNPKVSLSYKDDEGRILNTKQAYKHLSHKYHNTGLSKRGKTGGSSSSKEVSEDNNKSLEGTII